MELFSVPDLVLVGISKRCYMMVYLDWRYSLLRPCTILYHKLRRNCYEHSYALPSVEDIVAALGILECAVRLHGKAVNLWPFDS